MTVINKTRKWVFLSYEFSSELSAYGNGDRIQIEPQNRIKKGHSSNTSLIKLSSHFGTHIDFPYHFLDTGSSGSDYNAEDFVFNKVKLVDISDGDFPDFMVYPEHLPAHKLDASIEFLIIKTGFCHRRSSDNYWEKNPGLAPGLAVFFKNKMPRLKAVGFDSISLSSWQRRETGRIAHKEFLGKHNILIVEDMDLSKVEESTNFETVILSPFRFKNADGGPLTIFAEINNEN